MDRGRSSADNWQAMSPDLQITHVFGPQVSDSRMAALVALFGRTLPFAMQQVRASQRACATLGNRGGFQDRFDLICAANPSASAVAVAPRRVRKTDCSRSGDVPTILHFWSADETLDANHVIAAIFEVEPGQERELADREPIEFPATAQLRLVARTETLARRLQRAGATPEKCVVIRDMVDPNELEPARRSVVRRQLGFAPQQIVVLALPPVLRSTGTFLATWATLLLEKVRSDLRLLIPAGGRELERVRRIVQSCRHEYMVRFTGPECTPAELVAAADLALFLPSGDAPVSGLAWAMAAGLPIVASDVAVVREFLRDGETAGLCAPKTPAIVAGTMLRAIEQPAESQRRAEAARAAAADLFDRQRLVEQYTTLYAGLARTAPGTRAVPPL